MTDLPDGWRYRRLGEIADEIRGSVTPMPGVAYELWSVPAFSRRVPDLVDGADVGSAKRRVRPGDVLLCKINPRINRVWMVGDSPSGRQQIASPEWLVLRTSEVEPRYLKWVLAGPEFRDWIVTAVSGVTGSHTRAKADTILKQLVPVPPMAAQRRIVDILEDHLSRLDAATANVKSCQIRAQGWRRSAIDRIVWRNGEEDTVAVADLLAEKMRNGHSARVSTTGAGLRALTLTSVTRNTFTDAFTKVVAVDEDRVRDLWLRDGDILVQRSNTPDLVGTTAIFRGPNNWAIFPDLLIRLRADERRVAPAYLAAAMRTDRVHRRLRAQAKGLAGSMPKIDQAAIGSVLIPVPSLAAQDDVVTSVAEIEEGCSRLVSGTQAADRRVEGLRRALLSAAFSGRLTA